MASTTAIIVIVLVLIISVLIFYVFNSKKSLSNTVGATTMQTIPATSLATNNNPVNFAYSIWFFVNDWQYNYGSNKIIFGRMSSSLSSETNLELSDFQNNSPCPVVLLGDYPNDLLILLDQTPSTGSGSTLPDPVVVTNVPLQKWVHLVISVYGKTMDTYIDGKLVRTTVMAGTANVDNTESVYITPCGGFNGWTSNLQYFATPLNPQQVWSMYQQGYSGSWMSTLSNTFNLTVTVNNNGVPTKTFTL